MALHGTADVAIKAIPMISIVVRVAPGNTPKKFKKAAIRHNATPGTNRRRNPCFWVTIVGPPIMLRTID